METTALPPIDASTTAAASSPAGHEDMDWSDVDLTPRAPQRRLRPRKGDGSNQFARPPGLPYKQRRGPGRPRKGTRYPAAVIDTQVGYLRIDLASLLEARNIVSRDGPNLAAFQRGADLNYRTAWRLLRAPHEIGALSVDIVAKVCEFLHCQPGDWIKYVPVPPVLPHTAERGR